MNTIVERVEERRDPKQDSEIQTQEKVVKTVLMTLSESFSEYDDFF